MIREAVAKFARKAYDDGDIVSVLFGHCFAFWPGGIRSRTESDGPARCLPVKSAIVPARTARSLLRMPRPRYRDFAARVVCARRAAMGTRRVSN